jgi:hypothetical protein
MLHQGQVCRRDLDLNLIIAVPRIAGYAFVAGDGLGMEQR